MINQVIKIIGAGILGGIFLFAIPFFLFKVFFFILFVSLFLRLLGWRSRRRWMYYHMYRHGYHQHDLKKEGLEDHFQQGPKSV